MSGERVRIDLLPVNAVVQYDETLDAVGSGILDGHITEPSYFAGRDPAFALFGNLTGAWNTPLDLFGFMDHGGGNALFQELVAPYNLHFIGASATGGEALVSRVPIRSIEDFAGVRIRAPEGLVQDVFAAVGAAPVLLPYTEVYTALERGVIDAADFTVFAVNHDRGFHELARYPLYPGFHSMPMVEVSMNRDRWDALPADIQAIFTTATRDFALDMTLRLDHLDSLAVDEARRQGIEIVEWPLAERARFRAIAQSQWARWAERSPMATRTYEQAIDYLTVQGLLVD